MVDIIALAVIIGLVIALIAQDISHAVERKDLYNRIMAKDLTDLNGQGKKSPGKSGNFIKQHLDKIHQTND